MRNVIPAALACAAFFIVAAPTKAQSQRFGNVNVAGVSVSSLNREEALRRLRRELAPKLDTTVTLAAGPREVVRKRKHIGAELDLGWMLARAETGQHRYVPLKLRVNRNQAVPALRRLASNFRVEGRPARPIYTGGKVQIRPEQDDIRLNVGGSVVRVTQGLENDAATRRIVLAVHRSTPDLTAARLEGIDAILATYTSKFNPGNVGRTTNMRLGIQAIDGTLLSPGEVFSLNETVGERTPARGYKEAIIFEDGYKVPGIGGGISQVTGTLFNAALLAGLPIETYRTHSRPVDYIPIGRDATVAWNLFDMKFRNNRDVPIFISYTIDGNRATARLFGPKTNQKVDLRVTSQRIGPREIKAQLYRTIRQDGKVVTEEKVGNSHYKWNEGEPEE